MNRAMLSAYILTVEISTTARRIKYFSFHLDRCNSIAKAKLIVINCLLVAYLAQLITSLNNILNSVKDSLCLPNNNQKILN
jgi:hypothetical protein